jgi:glycogen debranching enzyme
LEDTRYELKSELVFKRGIYKDTFGSKQFFADYQLRPNMAVALLFAPELFVEDHKENALEVMMTHLLGPLGIFCKKTDFKRH